MVFLLLMMAILNSFTGDLLVKCSVQLKISSYHEIAERAFGRATSILVDLLIIIAGLGGMTVFQVLIGDFACQISIAAVGYCNRVILVYVISAVLVFPLSLLSNINSLRVFSFASLALIAFFSGVVVVSSILYMQYISSFHTFLLFIYYLLLNIVLQVSFHQILMILMIFSSLFFRGIAKMVQIQLRLLSTGVWIFSDQFPLPAWLSGAMLSSSQFSLR